MADEKNQPSQQPKPQQPEGDDVRVPEDRLGQEKDKPPHDRSQTPGKIHPL